MLMAEGRALLEAAALVPSVGLLLASAPRGDGHHVVVIPPFGAGDSFTTVLRAYLRRLGYRVHRWDRAEVLGLHRLTTVALPRISELRRTSEGRLSIVGHSLGGIYAREVARSAPENIRDVISIGSPFAGDMKSNYVWPMYEVATGTRIDSIPTRFLEQMSEPPGVPATAIFSRSDGVAHWSCCVERDSPTTENIEVIGSHIGLLHNPAVFYVIANRLAQAEGNWQPFKPSALMARLARPAQ
jgi:pimeloyl-ACP methyl ester carboxylesterase